MIDVSDVSGPLGGKAGGGVRVEMHTALIFSSVLPASIGYSSRVPMVVRHGITMVDGRPVMDVGHLVHEDDVDDLLRLLRSDQATSRSPFLPADLVGLSSGFAAWCVEGRRRRMWFRFGGKSTALNVVWPHLVIAAAHDRVHVCAVAKPVVRGQDVRVFHAPLMNIYDTGRVCMPGSARVAPGLDGRDAAQQVVFDTAFSHVNHTRTLRGGRGKAREVDTFALHAYWKARARAATPPPVGDMVPMGRTLSQWLAEIAR